MGDPINDLVKGFSKNELIGYFLILWAITFIFSAISGFIWIAEGDLSIIRLILEIVWDFAEIGCGLILILLGFKILNEKQ
jgi:hypothetical protein